jgi:hypothetical protein
MARKLLLLHPIISTTIGFKMTRYFQQLMGAAFAIAALAVAPVQAATILFQDNFDNDSAVFGGNFNSFINWTVSNGTVDYLRNGDFGIGCVGGSGGCVDLDGGTNNAGRMTSNTTFNFLAGQTYQLDVVVSGNQRSFGPDDFTLEFGGATITYQVPDNQPFTTLSLQNIFISATSSQIFLDSTSADNRGVIVDNVVLRCLTCQPNNVPEPSVLALLGLGLFGVSFTRKRS